MTAACHYINTAMKDMKRIFFFSPSFFRTLAPLVIQFLDVIQVAGVRGVRGCGWHFSALTNEQADRLMHITSLYNSWL